MDISGTVFTFESPPPAATAMEIEAALILSGNWVVASTACPFRRANHLLEPALEMDHDSLIARVGWTTTGIHSHRWSISRPVIS